jgi:hypothetical protein
VSLLSVVDVLDKSSLEVVGGDASTALAELVDSDEAVDVARFKLVVLVPMKETDIETSVPPTSPKASFKAEVN